MSRRVVLRNRNTCHRITTDLVRKYGAIAVEKLRIADMTRSNKGPVGEPRKDVAAASGLNRSIQEQTWGLLRQQLAYKAEWAGRQFVEVDPKNTSRDCSRCGGRNDPGKSKRYRCSRCGARMDRDFNAAVNILRPGTAPSPKGRMACKVSNRRACRSQENLRRTSVLSLQYAPDAAPLIDAVDLDLALREVNVINHFAADRQLAARARHHHGQLRLRIGGVDLARIHVVELAADFPLDRLARPSG